MEKNTFSTVAGSGISPACLPVSVKGPSIWNKHNPELLWQNSGRGSLHIVRKNQITGKRPEAFCWMNKLSDWPGI